MSIFATLKDINTMMESDNNNVFNYYLDITRDVCPMTFVRTKLLIERMKTGETLEIHLLGAEPLLNVPRSVRESGHTVLCLEPIPSDKPMDGIHRLVIKKN